ncbi:hypothetical protein RAS2_15180 [Phycisphaerae bacterium RAS2]|nr:hypothetical protein RAS2_15180 [Phycisphaerae bacterium RAS2]
MQSGRGAAREATGKIMMVVTSRLLAMGVSVVGLYFYTRILDKSDWAAGLIMALIGETAFAMLDMGLGLCLERRLPEILAREHREGLTLIGVFVVVVVASAVIVAIALYGYCDPLARALLKDPLKGWVVLWGIPFSMAIIWRSALFCMMRGTNCFGRLSVLSLSSQILFVAGTVSGYLLLGLRGFLLGAAIAYGLPCAYETWKLRRYFAVVPAFRDVTRYLKYSRSMLGERVVNAGYSFADQWVIGLVLPAASLATYNVPRSFFDRFQTLVEGIWMVPTTLLSRESARGPEAVRAAMRRLRRVFTYLFVPLGVGLLASSYFLVDILGGSKYHDAVEPFAILAIHYLVMGLAAANAIIGISTIAPPGDRLRAIVFKNLAYLISLPLLAHWFELNGVVGAKLLATVVEAIVAAVLMRRVLQVKWEWDSLRAIAMPAALLFVVVAGGHFFFYSRFLALLFMATGAVIYLFLFFRRVAEEDLMFLEHILPIRLRPLVALGRRCRPVAA